MKNMTKLIRSVLNELYKVEQESNQSLNYLMEYLENKDDPSSSEIMLVDSIYQFFEKRKLLESHLKKFISEKKFTFNKLETIYEDQKKVEDWDL